MKRAACPSCGAEVLFRSAASILAVCEYCHSTLLRQDLTLENLGKMAELLEDASPVQLGSKGDYRGQRFTVIGRIQLKYEAGLWNEWYVLFRNGKTGWLGETPGLCAMSSLKPLPDDCPPFEKLWIGLHLTLDNRDFKVINLERARCIAGEGELPFRVGAGYDSPVADLRGAGQDFATLDYSENPPLLFVGEQLDFKALSLTNLREIAVRGQAALAETFRCTRCGSPLEPKAQASVVIVCGSCGSVHDLQNPRHPILYQAELERGPRPWLALGSRGRLRGQDYEVIGFLQRDTRVEGIRYRWSEYLLLKPGGGCDWLSEYQGHWNYIRPTTHMPAIFGWGRGQAAQYQQRRMRHFQTSEAKVSYVLGEFYWRVTLGEAASIRDFVDPPYLLSEERSEKELLYSFSEYLNGDEVRAAFKIDTPFPEPEGVYANQPSPWQGKVSGYWWRFGVLALLFLIAQIGLVARSGSVTALTTTLSLERTLTDTPETTHNSQPFDLRGGFGPVEVAVSTDLADNNWVDVNVALVAEDSDKVYTAFRELGFYSGRDEDGYWSEGERATRFRFAKVPDGRYTLAMSAEGDPAATWNTVNCTVSVRRDRLGWTNFVLALLALATWPGIITLRHNAFETRRWLESDHPPASDD